MELPCPSVHAPPPARVPFASPRSCVPPPSLQRIAPGAASRILVIDADPTVTGFVRRSLAKDYDIVECHHADAALAAIARGERYDVVLCDLSMRGLTGAVLYSAVIPINAELARRFVFVIGDAPNASQSAFLQGIPNLRLTKPFQIDELRKAVGVTVHRASEGQLRIERFPSSGTHPRHRETIRGA